MSYGSAGTGARCRIVFGRRHKGRRRLAWRRCGFRTATPIAQSDSLGALRNHFRAAMESPSHEVQRGNRIHNLVEASLSSACLHGNTLNASSPILPLWTEPLPLNSRWRSDGSDAAVYVRETGEESLRSSARNVFCEASALSEAVDTVCAPCEASGFSEAAVAARLSCEASALSEAGAALRRHLAAFQCEAPVVDDCRAQASISSPTADRPSLPCGVAGTRFGHSLGFFAPPPRSRNGGSSPCTTDVSPAAAVGARGPAVLRGTMTNDMWGTTLGLSLARASTTSSSSSSWTALRGGAESSTCSGVGISDAGGARWCDDDVTAAAAEVAEACRAGCDDPPLVDAVADASGAAAVRAACREMALEEAARGRAVLAELHAFRRGAAAREAALRARALRGAAAAAASGSGGLEEVAAAVAELGELRASSRMEVGALEAVAAGAAAGCCEARLAGLAAEERGAREERGVAM